MNEERREHKAADEMAGQRRGEKPSLRDRAGAAGGHLVQVFLRLGPAVRSRSRTSTPRAATVVHKPCKRCLARSTRCVMPYPPTVVGGRASRVGK